MIARGRGKELVRTLLRLRPLNQVITRLFRCFGHTRLLPLISKIPVVGEVHVHFSENRDLIMVSDGLDPIAARVFWGGLNAYEPGVFRTLRSLLSPSDSTVVDVGANTGIFTLFLAAMGFTRVVAFEPVPDVHIRLCRNIERNGFRNVEMVQTAVLDRIGSVTLHVPNVVPVPLSASVKGGFWPVTRSVVVECTTLDAFLSPREDQEIAFVKIDVEGAAFEALSGMKMTVARWQPVILCEVLQQDSLQELDILLSSWGYRAFCLTAKGIAPVDGFVQWQFEEWEINFLLVPRERRIAADPFP